MYRYFFNRHFFLLWLGRSVSQLGDGAGFIAVMWWVQAETGSALALGTLAAAKGLTATLAAPLAGVLADRLDRKKIIVGTDLIRGVIYLALGSLAWTGSLTLSVLIGLSCLSVVCGQLFFPAVGAAVPLLVPRERLERANALNEISGQIVRVAGFSAGGIMVALFGVPALLLINGMSFLLSAVSEMFIFIPRVERESEPWSAGLFIQDFREALLYLRENRVLVRILSVAMALNFFFAPIFVLLPIFVSDHLNADSAVYGYLLSANMLGAVLATLMLSVTEWVQGNLWAVKWGIAIQSALMFLLLLLPAGMWVGHLAVFLVVGLFNAVVNIYFQTLLQRMTRPDFIGKMFGLVNTATGALQPAAQGLAGAAASVFSVPAIFAVSFGCCTAAGAGFAFIPQIDEFLAGEERDAEPAAASHD